MNQIAVIAILVVLGALPLWGLVAIFTSEWWRTSGWKQTKRKLPGPLLVLGLLLLFTVLLYEMSDVPFQSPQQFLDVPKTTVSGTVEKIRENMEIPLGKYANDYSYTLGVRVDGEWYETACSYPDEEEEEPEVKWLRQAKGKKVELVVYDDDIYKITDADGNVILDAEDYRMEEYELLRESRAENLVFGGISVAMLTLSGLLTLLRKLEKE